MSRTLLLLPLLLLGLIGCASQGERKPRYDRMVWETSRFISAHPDVHERQRALWLLEKGKPEQALVALSKAARHADKASQAMLAELHWDGLGVPRDRARAYAWMDLAAERGYTLFLAKRESYWEALDAEQRGEALRIGLELYAEYGDQVAKPRMDTLLRRARNSITGSRVGFVGALTVIAPTRLGWMSFSGEHFYNNRFWRTKDYYEWTDSLWQDLPEGTVTVGEPEVQRPAAEG
jgi:hypothetical protein